MWCMHNSYRFNVLLAWLLAWCTSINMVYNIYSMTACSSSSPYIITSPIYPSPSPYLHPHTHTAYDSACSGAFSFCLSRSRYFCMSSSSAAALLSVAAAAGGASLSEDGSSLLRPPFLSNLCTTSEMVAGCLALRILCLFYILRINVMCE